MTKGDGVLRVLLVDDQAMVRSGFRLLLSVEDDIEVVGEAADGQVAIDQARALRPDVVLMDVQMPVLDGIAATREIVAQDLAKVLILTTFDVDDYVFAGLEAGASGFLLKNADPAALIEAVRAVGHGHALLSPEVTGRVISRMVSAPPQSTAGPESTPPNSPPTPAPDDRLAQLTEREREVLLLLGRGLSNAEIATELVVGEATVKTHVSNVLAKLHLRDRVQAVIAAYETGLLTVGESESPRPD